MRKNNKKQRITLDFSKCRYSFYDKRCTRFNNSHRALLCMVHGNADADFICRAKTKKALLRQLRKKRFPRHTDILIDTGVYIDYYSDCDFTATIQSNPT